MNNIDPKTPEQRWFATLDQFQVITDEIEAEAAAARAEVDALVGEIGRSLDRLPPVAAELRDSVDVVRDRFEAVVASALTRWQDGELARKLSESLSDRLVLLVYGKVNAGKSSLMNFIIDRATAHGLPSQCFRLEGGERVDIEGKFATGATETTSCIQGAEIGKRLILLDSPGLHSVTPVNQALTERFVAAADGALLLTSSGSPGHRQELGLLAAALRDSERPIICVITRSDENEPDEVDGELVDRFVNWNPERRRLQEENVLERARQEVLRVGADELTAARLLTPLSVSALCAEQDGCTPQALAAAGFDQLFEALTRLADKALGYKRDKPLQQALEHRRQLQQHLRAGVLPALGQARQAGSTALKALDAQAPRIVDAVSGFGLRALFDALQRHEADRDVEAALAEVQDAVRGELEAQVQPLLAHYRAELGQLLVQIDPEGLGGYDEQFVDIEQVKGSGLKAVGSTAGAVGGAAGGAALGSVVPVVGTAVLGVLGGLIGGLLGRKAGDLGVKTYTVRELVGVSFDQLQAKAEPRMRAAVRKAVEAVQGQCESAVNAVDENLAVIEQQVLDFSGEQTKPRR